MRRTRTRILAIAIALGLPIGWLIALPVATSDEDPVVAVVGEHPIRSSDVYRQIENLPLGQQIELRRQLPRFIESVIREEILFQYVLTEVLDRDTEFRDLAKSLLVQRYIESQSTERAAVSREEIQNYYEANASQVRGEHWRLRHIPLNSSARCDELLALATSEEAFEALAREHGTDPELAASGGDIGYFMAHHDVLGLGGLVFKLPLHQPFKFENQDGCHLIWMTEHVRPPVPPVAEVSERLEAFLRGRKEAKLLEQLVEQAQGTISVQRPKAGN